MSGLGNQDARWIMGSLKVYRAFDTTVHIVRYSRTCPGSDRGMRSYAVLRLSVQRGSGCCSVETLEYLVLSKKIHQGPKMIRKPRCEEYKFTTSSGSDTVNSRRRAIWRVV
jgi:hypothetical protein